MVTIHDRMTHVPRKKTAAQLDADIADVIGKPRKPSTRKPKKSLYEVRTERLKARLATLQEIMADVFGDDGWLETDPWDLEKWLTGIDEDLSDRQWLETAKNQLIDASVLPEHAGAPPENVRRWNDVFISTYRMNIDSGMTEEDALDSARQNAHDTIRLASNEHGLINTNPALYKSRWRR
jgi:hypothetical protein